MAWKANRMHSKFQYMKSPETGDAALHRPKKRIAIIKFIWIAVKWNYGDDTNLFDYLRNLEKLRVMRSRVNEQCFTLCVLLRNCHITLYACQSSNYFDIPMKVNMLEKMMNFGPQHQEEVDIEDNENC